MIEGLAEIATPAPVSWMPQTWGWAVLGAVIVMGAMAWGWRWRQRSLANRYRAEALTLLAGLEPRVQERQTRDDALIEVAALLKRTALAAYPRPEVAPLWGAPWVTFLSGQRTRAAEPAMLWLNDLEYRPRESLQFSDQDALSIVQAARTRIRGPRVSA